MFAKKSRNIINLISLISLFGLLVSAASLVVILSGFNGIQKYVEDVYGKFAASLYIYPQTGKFIQESDSIFSKLEAILLISSSFKPKRCAMEINK